MAIITFVLIVPAAVALSVQLICYQQYMNEKAGVRPELQPA